VTPEQFLTQVKRQPAAVYLLIGPEIYQRDECRRALVERVLPPEEREEGLVRHDLEDITLAAVIDDARSLSMFAPRRVIWVSRAEAVLPKGRAAAAEDRDSPSKSKTDEAAGLLAAYVKDPSPDVVLVFDSAKFEFDGDDKTKTERMRKFFTPVKDVVEFPRLPAAEVRRVAQDAARARNLRIGVGELNLLVEATGGSAALVVTEIEKLSLFAGDGGIVRDSDIAALVPQAQSATIFALVAALGRDEKRKALDHLDSLVREGEYLPLALQFLASQFRQALTAKEAGLRSGAQVQGHFSRLGVPMWASKAEQVIQTVHAFSEEQLRKAVRKMAQADLAMRGANVSERVVMEDLVLNLTR